MYLQYLPRWKKPALLKALTDVVVDVDAAVGIVTTTTVMTVITTIIMTTVTTADVTAVATRPLQEEDVVVR